MRGVVKAAAPTVVGGGIGGDELLDLVDSGGAVAIRRSLRVR